MKFSDTLKEDDVETIIPEKSSIKIDQVIVENKQTPEEILRGASLKIKQVIGTAFGIQIDFAKKYKDEVIEDLLADFTIKIKDKSVFIVD